PRHMKTSLTGGLALAAALIFASTSTPAALAEEPAVVHPQLWPSVRPHLPPDPALEREVNAIFAGMTLEQKVGQLIQGDISALTPQDLLRYPLGSVLNGGNSKPAGNMLAPPSAWLTLANQFYQASMAASHGPHPIPEIW